MIWRFSNVKLFWLAFAFVAFFLGACKKNSAEDSLKSDATGFYCRQCNAKFYTASGVYADHCPQCKSADIRPVIGFVCYQDQQVTLTAQGPKSMPCQKCGAVATGLKMPRESDLKAWGAVRKTAAEVGAK